MNSEICPVYLKLPVEQIVALKNYLETYEGLGELRTLDREKGEVVILALGDTVAEVRNLISSVKIELSITEIPKPDSVKNDWLLSEEES